MRIDDYWFPYHTALQRLLDAAHTRFGEAILIDCHSMPHEAIENCSPSVKSDPRLCWEIDWRSGGWFDRR